MKITHIEVMIVAIPRAEVFKLSSAILADDHVNVITRVETDDGIVGYGEATSMEWFSGESAETMKATIDRYLSPALLGKDPFAIEQLAVVMDHAVFGQPFAKSAVEIALWDIKGRALGVPVYELLGGLVRAEVPLRGFIKGGISSPEEMAASAREEAERGCRLVKMKVGIDPRSDIEHYRAVVEAVGPAVDIQVDANQGYPDAGTAIRALAAMEAIGQLAIAEQPLPRTQLRGLAEVAKVLKAPIMADESVFSISDAFVGIGVGAVESIIIKLGKHGGLLNSKKIAAIAETAGVPLSTGMMGMHSAGSAAEIHFAAATPGVTIPVNVSIQRSLTDSILVRPLIEAGPSIAVPRDPGLGIEIDTDKLAKYTIAG
ncbi:MAG TPA: enolase C-terminal domain-like protein [bacterium]